MKDELLNIYDQDNQLIGAKARSLVHSEGDWHRTVHVYIINSKNALLVHLRSPLKDLYPNQWDTRFGGHVLADSDYDDTVQKELQEEIGLNVGLQALQAVDIVKSDDYPDREFAKIYLLRLDSDFNKLKFNDGEVVEVKWMSFEEIAQAIAQNPEQWVSSKEEFQNIIGKLQPCLNQ